MEDKSTDTKAKAKTRVKAGDHPRFEQILIPYCFEDPDRGFFQPLELHHIKQMHSLGYSSLQYN